MIFRDKEFQGDAQGEKAVEALGGIAKEREKTKRLLIGAACLFFIIAALVVVFAPSGKEQIAKIFGAVLAIMALGAIGASQFRLKLPGGIDVDTRSSGRDSRIHAVSGESVARKDDHLGPKSA